MNKKSAIIINIIFVLLVIRWVNSMFQTSSVDTGEKEYMAGCTENGAGYKYCKCTYDYLDERLTDKEFLDLAHRAGRTGEVEDVVVDAANSCEYLWE